MKAYDFAFYVSRFFLNYLPGSRNVSENTILSYRDTFTKFLTYCQNVLCIHPDKLQFSMLNRDTVENFLWYLEKEENCSISTRNQRLACIKSFFRYIEVECPELLAQCKSILTIKSKKCPKPMIDYLSGEETQLLLAQPDLTTRKGRRDMALLSLLYDSAARVQELCDLEVCHVRVDAPAVIRLYGKGRKSREVPLDKPCANILRNYIEENHLDRKEMQHTPLFFNSQRSKLSRSGVAYILSKYISQANENGGHISERITPHCLRHSKAMHMVEAGINLIYIRDFLGHESIETTQVYAKANPEARRKAIEKMESHSPSMPDWNDNPDLMDFLRDL